MTPQDLASYYTPKVVADAMAYWAIRNKNDTVFDPSYGGCSFLYAACDRLKEMNTESPGSRLYGVDVDPDALSYLDKLYEEGAKSQQFIHSDFFDVEIAQFGETLFDVVLGNPPYIRYHSLDKKKRGKAADRLKFMEMSISGTASYWAYFLLYSMSFIKPGGCIAMILPGAFLHTSYSQKVREYFVNNFSCVEVYLLEERIFDNTDEESVILCGRGAWQAHTSLHVQAVENTYELTDYLTGKRQFTAFNHSLEGDGNWLRALMTDEEVCTYEHLVAAGEVIRLGDYVGSRLGIVTGGNDFFILSKDEQTKRGLPNHIFKPVISKASRVKGLFLTDVVLQQQETSETPSLLFDPREEELNDMAIRKYLKYGISIGVPETTQCKSRPNWWQVPLTYVPEAIMPIMSVSWSNLVVNNSQYTCTNNILRLFWKDRQQSNLSWLQLAVGTVSSLSQLSSELVGRSYGGGILKLEPQDLSQLAIPILPQNICEQIASIINPLLVRGEIGSATAYVDNELIKYLPSFTEERIKFIREARNRLFTRRRKHRNDVERIIGLQ